MLKSFLTLFSQIIGKTQDQLIIDHDDIILKQTIDLYPALSEDEKRSLFDIIAGFDEQGFEYRLYFEFLCLHFYRDKRYAEDILKCILNYDMELSRRINYQAVLGRELFVTGFTVDYEDNCSLEKRIVEEVVKTAVMFPEYVPHDKRVSRSVVLVMRPFLGEYHSPTLQTINLDNYLRKLGYTTYYISYCENDILRKYSHDVCAPFTRSDLIKETMKFEYSCFDIVIKGLHFELKADTAADDLNALAVYISQINPEFVIGIEGGNILADICTKFTDVICMNVVDDLPVTLSNYVLRYFGGEYRNGYLYADKYNKKVFDAVYMHELQVYNDLNEQEIKLPEGKFHICIMGNRLDDELNEDMLVLIRQLASSIPEVDFLFIGKCPKTMERLKDMGNQCIFPGYVKRCEDAVAACSLFLNPPRKGGGGGGHMAFKRGVPVYTLRDCDVASGVGDSFAYDSFDDLIPLVRRYIDDPDYYESVRRKMIEQYDRMFGFDSLVNIKEFCKQFTQRISAK